MDIKRKKKEKRIQLLGGLIGICVAVVSLFYFFHAEKAEAEKRSTEAEKRRVQAEARIKELEAQIKELELQYENLK